MSRDDAHLLLDRIGVLKHACDLDLLVFFARHPRALLTSEQLAAWLGYELKQIAESLEILLEAGVLARTQNPTHAARLYVFSIGGSSGGWLPALLNLASTRPGRLSMIEELSRRASKATNDPVARSARHTRAMTRPRPFVVRQSDETSKTKTG